MVAHTAAAAAQKDQRSPALLQVDVLILKLPLSLEHGAPATGRIPALMDRRRAAGNLNTNGAGILTMPAGLLVQARLAARCLIGKVGRKGRATSNSTCSARHYSIIGDQLLWQREIRQARQTQTRSGEASPHRWNHDISKSPPLAELALPLLLLMGAIRGQEGIAIGARVGDTDQVAEGEAELGLRQEGQVHGHIDLRAHCLAEGSWSAAADHEPAVCEVDLHASIDNLARVLAQPGVANLHDREERPPQRGDVHKVSDPDLQLHRVHLAAPQKSPARKM